MPDRVLRRRLEGPGLFAIKVAGVHHYQSALRVAASLNTSELADDVNEIHIDAQLLSEPNNEFDPNAVAVLVGGMAVGYLERQIALRVHQQLEKAGYATIDATCPAIIRSITDNPSVQLSISLDLFTKGQKRQRETTDSFGSFRFFAKPSDNPPNESAVTIGERVRFWTSGVHPLSIRIYCNCSGYESVLVGLVPSKCVVPIAKHLQEDLEYEATVADYTEGRWEITGRVLSAEESEKRATEARILAETTHRERVTKDLSKPYRPRKAMKFTFNAPNELVDKGDEAEIIEMPARDELIDLNGPRAIKMRFLRTGSSFSCDVIDEILRKIIRLGCPMSELRVAVTEVETRGGAFSSFKSEIKVRTNND